MKLFKIKQEVCPAIFLLDSEITAAQTYKICYINPYSNNSALTLTATKVHFLDKLHFNIELNDPVQIEDLYRISAA